MVCSAASSGVGSTVGQHEHNQLLAVMGIAAGREQGAQQRNVIKERHAGSRMGLIRLDEAAQHDGVMVANGHGGIQRPLGGIGHVAYTADRSVTVKIINLLLNLHGDCALGVDERSHIQFDTDRELRVGRAVTISATIVVGAGDVGNRFTNEKLRWLGLRGLNARTLNDTCGTVCFRRIQGQLPIVANVGKVGETTGKSTCNVGSPANRAGSIC